MVEGGKISVGCEISAGFAYAGGGGVETAAAGGARVGGFANERGGGGKEFSCCWVD